MRRFLLACMLLISLLVVAAGGALFVMNTGPGSRYLDGIVNRLALSRSGLDLSWQRAHGTYLFNLRLDHPVLTTAQGDTLLAAESIKAWYWPWAFLKGPRGISRLEVDRAVFRLPALEGMASAGARGVGEVRASDVREVSRATEREEALSYFAAEDVIFRDSRIEIAREGLFQTVDGIHLRGTYRMSPGGGIQIDVGRLAASIRSLGLEVTDLGGGIYIRQGRLWLAGLQARAGGVQVRANGSLGLAEDTLSDLRLGVDGRELEGLWPLVGGAWIGPGPLYLRGRLLGRMQAPRFVVTGRGRVGGAELTAFSVAGVYAPGRFTALLQAAGSAADSLQARVDIDPRTGVGTLSVRADSLRLDQPPVGVPVRVARLEADIEFGGFDPLREGASLTLRSAGVYADGFLADSLNTEVIAADNIIRTVTPVTLAGTGYLLTARGQFHSGDRSLDLTLSGNTREPSQPLRFAGLLLEKGHVALDLRITGQADNPDVRGRLDVSQLQRGEVRVASSRIQVDVAGVTTGRVGTFSASMDSLRGGEGFLLPSAQMAGRIDGDTVTLRAVQAAWDSGRVDLEGNIRVTPDSIHAVLARGEMIHREIGIRGIRGGFDMSVHDGAGMFGLDFQADDGYADLEGFRDTDRIVHMHARFDELDLGRFSRSLGWPGTPEGTVNGEVFTRIATNVEELSALVEVAGPGVFEHRYNSLVMSSYYRAGTVTVDSLRLEGEGGERALARGVLHLPDAEAPEARGTLAVDVALSRVRVEPFARYLGGTTLRGTLDGRLTTSGTLADPRMAGDFTFTRGQVDTFVVEEAGLDLRYDGERLRVENGRLLSLGFTGRFEASLPVTLRFEPFTFGMDRAAPVNASFIGDGDPAAVIQPFRGAIESIGGRLTARANLTGTLESPDLSGRIQLEGGWLKPTAMGRQIQDLEIDLALDRDRVQITRFTGRLPSGLRKRNLFQKVLNTISFGLIAGEKPLGVFNVEGGVVFGGEGPPLVDLRLDGTKLGISDPTESLAIALDVPELTIRTDAQDGHPVVAGRTTVLEGIADYGLLLRMTAPAEAGGTPRDPSSLELNVEVYVPGRVRVTGGQLGQDVNAELRGDLLLVKEPGRNFYVLRELQVVPGRGQMGLYGHRWTVEQGTLTFGSIEEINPTLDIHMTSQIQDVLVGLSITGTARDPVTVWSSDSPALQSQSDIMQYVLLGYVGLGPEGQGIERGLTNYIEGAIGRQAQGLLGVDTFEISGAGIGRGGFGEDTQITVGWYLSPQWYVRVSPGLGHETGGALGDLGTEYRLSRRFFVSATKTRLGRYLLELKWRVEY